MGLYFVRNINLVQTFLHLANLSIMANELVIWDDKKTLEIKKLYAPDLTNNEFQIFCEIGKSTWLNPFLREIWAVKYGSTPASIFIGRDGYRKSAQASPLYDWHSSEDIRENDTFSIKDGEVIHNMNMKDRGKLVWAYALAQRKGATRPNYTRVDLVEYNTGKSVWATKPSTMIKKVAEAQVLRMTFQDLFAGTYDESEEWETKEDKKEKTAPRKVIDVTPDEPEVEIQEVDQDALYENYLSLLDGASTIAELWEIWKQIKSEADSLGRVYIDDLTDRVKSIKSDLTQAPKTPIVETTPVVPTAPTPDPVVPPVVDTPTPIVVPAPVNLDSFNAYITRIKASTTVAEINTVMVEIDSALTSQTISLQQYGVLISNKDIMMNKIPK